MFFIVFTYYCRDVLECDPWDILNIKRSGWYRFQKENRISLHHCKTICCHFGHHITDDMNELLMLVTTKYVETK